MAWIEATGIKQGTTIILDGSACTVKSIDISKSGKHGASKCRIEAISVVDGKKKIIAVPGSERFETPMIEKRRAQIVSVNKDTGTASIMDLESFEILDAQIDSEVQEVEGRNVEYWLVDGRKIIKRTI